MRIAGIALIALSTLGAAEKFVPLFDGRTLDGWKQLNGTAPYAVEDRMIVGTTAKGSPNSFLCTTREYGDFILEFEARHDPELNSGVQLRAHQYARETETLINNQGWRLRKQPAGRVYGYQLEIATGSSGNSGGIFDEARRGWIAGIEKDPVASKALKDNQWNRFRVEAIGDHIRTFVNGVACADLVDPLDLTGFIGLQVHQNAGAKPFQVRWRNIRIADLGRHEWKPLWDGKSLDGWTRIGGGEWKIEDGALHGTAKASSAGSGFLASAGDFDDFTVRLKYKIATGNSGVFFRMADPAAKEPGPMGYEIEVDPTRDPGGLLEPRGRMWMVKIDPKDAERYYRPNDWNELAISAHADRVVLHVNGYRTADLKKDPGRRKGRLALQLNPKQDLDVWFKDIEILRPAK
ncbi:MAG: DUF1080 domain-containing protein [Bryobacterales bacterium]|nr:DUF1080 domain-containing protein [Bryobacterales bacterium]